MTITKDQRTTIMKLWSKVCKDRGWKSSDRDFRLAKFGEIIGRPIKSADDIERIDECTKLMKELKAMLGMDITAAEESDNLYINRARVLRNQILTEIIPCLELYRGAELFEDMIKIMENKNRWWKIDRPVRRMTLMDLDAKPIIRKGKFMGSQLSQMQWTLARWLNNLRNDAGDTIHQMNQKARVACKEGHCSICFPKVALVLVKPAPEEQPEPEVQPF